MIHTKCQDLFSLKNKENKIMLSVAVMIGILRVKIYEINIRFYVQWLLYIKD